MKNNEKDLSEWSEEICIKKIVKLDYDGIVRVYNEIEGEWEVEEEVFKIKKEN